MRKHLRWILVCVLFLSLLPTQTAQAARGIPGSPDLGYGAWLFLDGRYFDQSLALLEDLKLDWVAIEIDWSLLAAKPNLPMDTTRLDQAVNASAACGTAIMISLTNPPDWAMTASGPDAAAVGTLVLNLSQRYGEKLIAVELLPGANTSAGWGTKPSPSAYASLFVQVKSQLAQSGSPLLLISGGLRPLTAGASGVDWDDLEFLRGLYAAGASEWMEVLSIQFTQLTGDPLQTRSNSGTTVRHYEEIRQVMLDFDHATGLLWVTRINPPDGTISIGDREYANRQSQTEWLQQALIQVRSQLYMGVVFTHSLNPPESNQAIHGRDALVLDSGSIHPFYSVLKAIIHHTNPDSGPVRPGMPKSTILLKSKNKT